MSVAFWEKLKVRRMFSSLGGPFLDILCLRRTPLTIIPVRVCVVV
jgi:hypothetical protein